LLRGSLSDAPGTHAHPLRSPPCIHAAGESPETVAKNLAQDLAREIEGLAHQDRREIFQRALTDVRAFITITSGAG
jgi:hypothetical protein